MAFTLIQAGSNLKSMNSAGAFSPALTLPSGVGLATNRIPRFAKFKEYVIVVNTPSRPLSVDTAGIVRVLTPIKPATAAALSAGASGSLSGTYLAIYAYGLQDALGNIIALSDYSPLMTTPVSITAKKLHMDYALAPDAVDFTQTYRTTTNGAVYFPWTKVLGNVVTSVENDNSDASLGSIAAPSLGTAPDLTLIAEWAGRLWGVDRLDVDDLRYTEAGTMYGWSALNTLSIPHIGSDSAGVTALIPRRAALGVTRRDLFQQVTGSDRTNFKPTVVNGGEQMGCLSQESVKVFNDNAYFLWRDGVYRWDSNGIVSITNGKVRTWFTSDLYFNRALFWRSFAQLDPIKLRYKLFLASAGSSVIDRWIEYDLTTDAWFGPHKTDAFNPTCALLAADPENQDLFLVGSAEGFLSQESEIPNDWGISPIVLSASTRKYDMGEPEDEKFFGELAINAEAQPGTLTVTPTVGELETATPSAPYTPDLTTGRQRLGRIGVGKQMSLQFDHSELNKDVLIYGFEVDPVNIVGRR